LPGGCAAFRRWLAPARLAPRLHRPRPSSASRGGAPRCPHVSASPTPAPDPHAGDPVASGAMAACTRRADSSPPPKKKGRWEGDQIRRCRGWPITPEPAGTGRASRAGETAARFFANAEGPRRGSRFPVAGGGACRRRARGRPSLQKVTAAPATKGKASRSETQMARAQGMQGKKTSRSGRTRFSFQRALERREGERTV